jgi:predicted nucleic acid-binding protein
VDHELVILFQNMVEFWNNCTRPRNKNGLGYSVQETDAHLLNLLSSFTILSERHEISETWPWVVLTNEVKGVQVHDARLAAAMKVYGIRHMLTYNGKDFKRFPWISILTPKEVLSEWFSG